MEHDDKRRLRKTKAAIKNAGKRAKRRTLKEQLARDPESAHEADYRLDRSDSSKEFAEQTRGRLA